VCYYVGMRDKTTQVAFRLTPLQIDQLTDLSLLYGSQSRALAVALDTHWRMTADERARQLARQSADNEGDDAPADAPDA